MKYLPTYLPVLWAQVRHLHVVRLDTLVVTESLNGSTCCLGGNCHRCERLATR